MLCSAGGQLISPPTTPRREWRYVPRQRRTSPPNETESSKAARNSAEACRRYLFLMPTGRPAGDFRAHGLASRIHDGVPGHMPSACGMICAAARRGRRCCRCARRFSIYQRWPASRPGSACMASIWRAIMRLAAMAAWRRLIMVRLSSLNNQAKQRQHEASRLSGGAAS